MGPGTPVDSLTTRNNKNNKPNDSLSDTFAYVPQCRCFSCYHRVAEHPNAARDWGLGRREDRFLVEEEGKNANDRVTDIQMCQFNK